LVGLHGKDDAVVVGATVFWPINRWIMRNGGRSYTFGFWSALFALRYVRPEILYPFTVAGPIVLMLIIGRFNSREHLSRTTLIACPLSIVGLVVLTLGQQ